MKITKAVIPAAGHGTRFLPFTKAVPKELLPLLNKPAIHYIAQEMVDAQLTDCTMIIAPHKQAIAAYFDTCPELEQFLKEKNKLNLIADVQKLSQALTFTYIHQEEAKGLGHAVSLARNTIGNNYFGILLPDDIMISATAGIAQLAAVAPQHNASVIAVQEMPQESLSAYGVVAIKKQLSAGLFEVGHLIEKPEPENAPSNLAVIGRYILSSKLFKALDEVTPAANGEIQLTDGITRMLNAGEKVLAYAIQGTRYDVGTPAGWLQANVELASHF